jgi:anti-sigma-K factor RskA
VSEQGHIRFEEEVGAYLLGVLSEREREAFEQHLAVCEVCRMDVERLRPAADALPRMVEQHHAPESLKASLMETVRGETGALPEREGRRSRMPRLRPQLAWAAAALLAAMALAAGFYALGRGADDPQRTVAAVVDDRRLGQAGGRLVIPDEGGESAVLELSGMPRPPSGHIYQVWLRRGDRVVPASMFNVSGDGEGAAGISGGLEDVDEVMVTRERGLARAPSEAPVLSVKL